MAVVLPRHRSPSTAIGRLVIPALESFEPRAVLKPALKRTGSNPSVRERSAVAAAFSFGRHGALGRITLFDDEALSRILRAEYAKLRGRWRALLGARSLHGACIVTYAHAYELFAEGRRGDGERFGQPAGRGHGRAWEDGVAGESRRLQVFRECLLRPESGAGKDELVQWLRQLGGKGEAAAERVAVKFEEHWSVWRLSVAIVAILIFSVAAALLWIFLGVGYSTDVVAPSLGSGGIGKQVLQEGLVSIGVGSRVEGGLLLGLLVLLLGWTGIAGWVALSWLTS